MATPIAESVLAGYKAEVKAGLQLTISEIVKCLGSGRGEEPCEEWLGAMDGCAA